MADDCGGVSVFDGNDYRAALEAASQGIAILDAGGRYLYMNHAHAAMYGYDSPQALIGRSWRVLYGAAEVDRMERESLPALCERGSWSGEIDARHREQRVLSTRVRLSALPEGRFVCVCEDIGKQERPARSLDVYEQMVAETHTPMSYVDAEYRFRAINDAYLSMYPDRTREEILDQPVASLVGEAFFEQVTKPEIDRCLAGERVHSQRWVGNVARESRFLDIYLDPYAGADGRIMGAVCTLRDITESKKTEEALRRSEHLLDAFFENSPSEVYFKDGDGRYLRISRQFEKDFRVKDAEVRGKLPHDVHYKALADSTRAQDLAVLETGRTVVREETAYLESMSDGPHTLLTIKFPIKDEHAQVHGLGAIAMDITERIRAEGALRESEARFRNLVEGSIEGVIIHRDAVPLFVNQSCADIFGYRNPGEMFALGSVIELEAPHERTRMCRYRTARTAGEDAPVHYEFDGLRKDGTIVNLINSVRVVSWQGEPAIQSTFVDITGKKRIEVALRNSHETLRTIIDTVPAIINARDAQHRFVFINAFQARLHGVSVKDAVGKTVSDLVGAEHGAYSDALNQRVLDSGEPIAFFEEAFRGADGKQRVLLTTKVPVPGTRGERWVTTVGLDISARKLAEHERERLIVELEARNTELERFTYTVSHDLKSPLITICGFVDLMEKDMDGGDASRCEKDLRHIRRAAERMQVLLEDVLELSRVGRLISPEDKVSIADVAAEALENLSQALRDKSVEARIDTTAPRVRADRTRLCEVLQNLVENAVKFTADQDCPRVDVGWRSDHGGPVFFVKDNGIGIDPAYHDKVFGLFERLDPGGEGTGVGLALVKRIIEGHGGSVWVESQGAGSGTSVCFTLPASASDA